MPLIMVLLFAFLNLGGNESSGSSSQYSLERTSVHPIKRTTAARDIKYFVRPPFEREVGSRVGRVPCSWVCRVGFTIQTWLAVLLASYLG